jgi:hypothetical protein
LNDHDAINEDDSMSIAFLYGATFFIWSKYGNIQSYPSTFIFGNISGANQPLRENYGNFNLSHMMLIQRSA